MFKLFLTFVLYICCAAPVNAAAVKQLRVVTEHFPPLQIWDQKQGSLTGIAVDVMENLLERTSNKAHIEVLPWARAYELALTRSNTLIFTIIRTEEREQHFKWVGSITPVYANYIWTLKTRSDIKITSWQEAQKYNAVAQRNGAQSIRLINHGFKEQENLHLVTNYGQGIKMVLKERADFFLGSDFLASLFLRYLNINKRLFQKSMPHDDNDSLNIAFNKHTPDETVNKFQQALSQMRQDGTLHNIVDKWTSTIE